MRKSLYFCLMFLILPLVSHSQEFGGTIKTSVVYQKWDIEDIDDPISEWTMPIEIVYPILENLNLQVNHYPALAQFGDAHMGGPSDTWLRSTYSFANDQALVSVGIGIPTGKTELDSMEIVLTRFLSQQTFKFQLPVYGQGLTLSSGIMYAYPVLENLTLGAGLNFVFRAKYKFSTINTSEYNPGEQLGVNLGFDYFITDNLRSTVDGVFNYYTPDKLNDMEVFSSGPRFSVKMSFQYQANNAFYWLMGMYQAKAKNEIYNVLDDKLEPEPKNSNITLRELHLGGRYKFNDSAALSVVGEVRSYVENEYNNGWLDLAGGGLIGEYFLFETFTIFGGFKMFFGDTQISGHNPNLQGLEIQLGSVWKF